MRGVAAVLLLLLALFPIQLEGQAERDQVLSVVQELFDAMAAGDAERAGAVLLPEGQLVVHRLGEDGSVSTGIMTHADFVAALADADEAWNERLWNAEVLVQGVLASVWTPYDFHRGRTFSHCGMEVFNLLRISGEWKIVGGTYTVESTGCPSSPLGPIE